jgi:DNA helicase IV
VYAFYKYFEGNKSSKEEQLLKENVGSASNQVLVSAEQASECARIEKEILEKASEIQKIITEITNNRTYLIYPSKKIVISKIENLQTEVNDYAAKKMLKVDFTIKMRETLTLQMRTILDYNKNFIQQRKKDYNYLWNKGNILLDDEQQTAIVTDDKYNLVVAAAGSGKTEVLITRIAYLIKRKPDCVQPNRILAIAYQRKAKEQIEQRLLKRYEIADVNVQTFHKLGKDILEKSGKKIERTDIIDENKKFGFIKSYFEEEIVKNSEFYKLFIRYADE